jgi:predicted aspartyl protease
VKAYYLTVVAIGMLLGVLQPAFSSSNRDQADSTTFPVTRIRSSGTPAAELSIGNTTGKFMFDTGFNASVISNEKADALGLTRSPAIGGDGIPLKLNGKQAELVTIPRVKIGNFELTNVHFVVTNGRELDSLVREPIDGIIGADFFVVFPALFDFQKNEITIWQSGRLSQETLTRRGFTDGFRIPVSDPRGAFFFTIPVRVNGTEESNLVVDTGAAITTLSERSVRKLALKPEKVFKNYPSFSGKLTLNQAKVNKISFGPFEAANLNIYYPSHDTSEFRPCIGLDVLTKFQMLLDFPHKVIYLKPTTPTPPPGGIGLSVEMNSQHQLMVVLVRDHSPAQEAGLLVGDEVLEVNGHLIRDLTPESLDNEMKKAASETITIRIRSHNQVEPRTVRLTIRKNS